jgi:hypothetical protein
MPASITLDHTILKTDRGTVKLVFKATGQDISSKVFAIEVLPKSADPSNVNYRFSHVCSPMELNEFPEDEPFGGCYFRVDEIGMIFDTPDLVDHVIFNMRKDIKLLADEYNALENTTPITGTYTAS